MCLFSLHMFYVRANGEAFRKPCFRRNHIFDEYVSPFLETLKLFLIVSFTRNQANEAWWANWRALSSLLLNRAKLVMFGYQYAVAFENISETFGNV